MSETETSREDVFTKFSSTFIFCRNIGFCSYVIKGSPGGFRYVTDSRLHKLINNLIHVVVILFVLYWYVDSVQLLESTPFLTLITTCVLLADMIRLIANVFFNKLHNAKTIELLNRLYSIERNLAEFGINFSYKISNNVLITCMLLETGLNVTLHGVFIVLMLSDKLRYLPYAGSVTYKFLIQLAVDYQFYTFTLLLKDQFQNLNSFMKNRYLSGRVQKDVGTIKCVSLLHQKLCEMVRDYNDTLSIPLLVCLGFYFCGLVLLIFNCLEIYQSERWSGFNIILIEILSVFPILVKIVAYIQVATSCMREARDIKATILKVASESDDYLLRKELSAFSLQILHENFHIHAGGFFALDYQLGLSILGSLATYTIILIQFGLNVGIFDIIKNVYQLQEQ